MEQTQARTKVSLFIIFLIIAVGLRCHNLTWHSLHVDEGWDLHIATLPLSQLLGTLFASPPGTYTPPPLQFIIIHAAGALIGEPLAAARLLSAAWNILTLLLIAIFLYPRARPATFAFGVLFFLAHPFQHYWAQQTRFYALLQFLVVAYYYMLYLFYKKASRRNGLIMLVIMVAGAYTHYFFMLAWLAGTLTASICGRGRGKRFWVNFITVNLLFIFCFIPWSAVMLKNVTDKTVKGAPAVITPVSAMRHVSYLLVGYPLPRSRVAITVRYAGLVSFCILFIAGSMQLWRQNRMLFIPGLLPIAMVGAAGLVLPVFSARYLIIVFVPLYYVAWRALQQRRSRLLLAAAAIHCLCLMAGTYHIMFNEYHNWEDFKGAAAVIRDSWQPQDVIVCVAPYAQLPLKYYLPETHYRYLPFTNIRQQQAGTIWLVWCYSEFTDPEGTVLRELSEKATLLNHIPLTRIDIYHYDPRE